MMDWACRLCMTLPEGDGLEEHIRAHARESVWSYDEVSQVTRELRVMFAHCPECKARINRVLRPPTMGESWTELSRALNAFFIELNQDLTAKFRDAGLLPEQPPTDLKARALWARRNRNTGPTLPSAQTARRPRRHK